MPKKKWHFRCARGARLPSGERFNILIANAAAVEMASTHSRRMRMLEESRNACDILLLKSEEEEYVPDAAQDISAAAADDASQLAHLGNSSSG